MNKKQTVKFLLLEMLTNIVLLFLFGMLFGIIGEFRLENGQGESAVIELIENIVLSLLVIPAISVAAKTIYKKNPIEKRLIKTVSVLAVGLTFLLSVPVFFAGAISTWVAFSIVFDFVLTYFATYYFLHKYSK